MGRYKFEEMSPEQMADAMNAALAAYDAELAGEELDRAMDEEEDEGDED